VKPAAAEKEEDEDEGTSEQIEYSLSRLCGQDDNPYCE